MYSLDRAYTSACCGIYDSLCSASSHISAFPRKDESYALSLLREDAEGDTRASNQSRTAARKESGKWKVKMPPPVKLHLTSGGRAAGDTERNGGKVRRNKGEERQGNGEKATVREMRKDVRVEKKEESEGGNTKKRRRKKGGQSVLCHPEQTSTTLHPNDKQAEESIQNRGMERIQIYEDKATSIGEKEENLQKHKEGTNVNTVEAEPSENNSETLSKTNEIEQSTSNQTKITFMKSMFTSFDVSVLESLLEENESDLERTIEYLMRFTQMNEQRDDEDEVEQMEQGAKENMNQEQQVLNEEDLSDYESNQESDEEEEEDDERIDEIIARLIQNMAGEDEGSNTKVTEVTEDGNREEDKDERIDQIIERMIHLEREKERKVIDCDPLLVQHEEHSKENESIVPPNSSWEQSPTRNTNGKENQRQTTKERSQENGDFMNSIVILSDMFPKMTRRDIAVALEAHCDNIEATIENLLSVQPSGPRYIC